MVVLVIKMWKEMEMKRDTRYYLLPAVVEYDKHDAFISTKGKQTLP